MVIIRIDYRHKITIKQQTTSQNLYGETLDVWTTVATVWAGAEPLIGREFFEAEQNQSKVEIKFRMHYMSGISDDMKITYNNEDYDILSIIDPKEQNRELLLMCRKKVS